MAGDPHVDVDRILRTVMVLRSATESLEHSNIMRTRHTFIDIVDSDEIGSMRRSQSCSGPVVVRDRDDLPRHEPRLQAIKSPDITTKHGVHAGQEAQLDVDNTSTNLYVGFLTPEWTEELLKSEFGHFGTVTSVKIMYPRTERQRLRGMNCGFVQFTAREEAERAKAHVDGKEYFGTCIRIGWGKAVQPKPPAGESNEVSKRAKEVRNAGGRSGGGCSPRSEDSLSSQSTGPPSSSA
eukprot:CAMPEP_0172864706 /NCGR_PEP_ID=MMETSP1075-20121228/80992_1 /TAXON_ID=2916 /ORGANISM="Ceratium fusus, Strain PA161109" /LENGTH=236 /DNA_ID=CAMNT_0013713659 /DNA_START=32 /DNA_END=738 /DNA_ORIENTATION=-